MNPMESTLLFFLIKSIVINGSCEFFVVIFSRLLDSFQNFMVGPDETRQRSDIH